MYAMDRVSYASSADDEMSKALLAELQKLVAQAGWTRQRLTFTPGHGARGELATGATSSPVRNTPA